MWEKLDALNVEAEESASILGHSEYRAVGRRVAILLSTAGVTFIGALRGEYGQYWIPPVRRWDSRTESLNDFCSRWGMEWSLDDGMAWYDFLPEGLALKEKAVTEYSYPTPLEGEYITKADWKALERSLSCGYQPTLASSILSQAHGYCDQGNLRLAFLEGVSALEVAIGDYLTRGIDVKSKESLQPFLGIGLAAQMTAISLAGGAVPTEQLKQTVEAIKIRNKVAHEGFDPPNQSLTELRALLSAVSFLLKRPSHKFPRARRTHFSGGLPTW